jgi:hypothetical protein
VLHIAQQPQLGNSINKPAGWLPTGALLVGALLAAALMAAATTVPGWDTWAFAVAALVYGVVALGTSVIFVVELRRGRLGGSRLALVAAALILVATAIAVRADVPFLMRFALSRSALESIVHQPTVSDGVVGLFEVRDYERAGSGARVTIVGAGVLEDWGLAYSPSGPPGPAIEADPPVGVREYRHLDGPWYVWEFRFT